MNRVLENSQVDNIYTRTFQKKNNRKWNNTTQKKNYKCKYFSQDGKKLAAGGIIFFDTIDNTKGLWLIKEEEDENFIYTDLGGKYDHNDGDIFATISREFREETYNTSEISYKNTASISKNKYLYINGYDENPVYL